MVVVTRADIINSTRLAGKCVQNLVNFGINVPLSRVDPSMRTVFHTLFASFTNWSNWLTAAPNLQLLLNGVRQGARKDHILEKLTVDDLVGSWKGFQNACSDPVREHNRRFSTEHHHIRDFYLNNVQTDVQSTRSEPSVSWLPHANLSWYRHQS